MTPKVNSASTMSQAGHSVDWGAALTILGGLMIIANLYMAFIFAPTSINLETKVEQFSQRIFYIHLGTAWVAFFALFVTGLAGVIFLIRQTYFWDSMGVASAEIGLMFMTIFLATGSIWAKPTWNTWWTWSPRLTISALSWLMYLGYLMLRGAIDHPARRARFSAIYGIFAFVSVPINFMAIRWWRDIHPTVVGTAASEGRGGFDMASDIRTTLIFSLVAITLFYITLMYHRINLEAMTQEMEKLKQKALQRQED